MDIVLSLSLPAWECGLKSFNFSVFNGGGRSLPAWECGLKYSYMPYIYLLIKSLPAWECGLKFLRYNRKIGTRGVTPCVGVWIEIGKRF